MKESQDIKMTITQSEFQQKKEEWIALNTDYDNLFLAFLNNPQIKASEEFLAFTAMQTRLYALELELHKIAEGQLTIEG